MADGAVSSVFPGDSEMSAAMRAHDWATHVLGPAETWPQALRVPLRMMLTSRFEMWLGWGPDLAFFYNDAYRPTLGSKHPQALGRPVREVWREIYADVADRIASVMQGGVPTWDKALLLLLERNGYPEETYHSFSYSPLCGEAASVEGLLCVVSEETERVISERRLGLLRTLATGLLSVRDRAGILAGVRATMQANRHDFPFAVLRLYETGGDAVMATDPGLEGLDWPGAAIVEGMAGAASGARPCALRGLLDDPPRGPWQAPAVMALRIPIDLSGSAEPGGMLVLGLNPYRPHDPDVEGFAQLLAAQVAGVLATVDAHTRAAAEMARLQDLFAQSVSFMAVLRGPDHTYELVNPAYQYLVQGRALLGRTVRESLPEVQAQGFLDLLDRVYTTGEPYVGRSMPLVIDNAGGEASQERFLDFVYQPIRNERGITGIFVQGTDVTSAHDAVAALRASEAQFRTFAQAVPNHVWTALPGGQLDWFNDRTFAYSGRQLADLAGQGWAAIVHADDVSAAGLAWAQALASGASYEMEFRIRRADGVYRWHLVRALPLRDDERQIVRWIGTNTDIHARKLAETESARDLDRSWTLSPVIKLVTTMDGDILALNPSWTRTLGWPEAATTGRNLNEFMAPEELAGPVPPLARLAAGQAMSGETSVGSSGGDDRAGANVQTTLLTREGGRRQIAWITVAENSMLYSFGRDVTAEVEAAAQLAASLTERDRIWGSTNDLMATVGHDFTVRSVNPAWRRLLGDDEATLLSRPLLASIDPADHAKLEAALARLSVGRPIANLELRLLHADGTRSLITWSAEPMGSVFYLVGRDVTDQRLAEEALRQSQKMEAVGQLTGGIAHDFNNLLQGITGSLDLVQKRLSQGRLTELDRFVNGAMTSAKRASALTHRLLAFSRRQPLDPRPVRANPLVGSMEDLLRRTLGERVDLELALAGGLWLTLCDPNQLENAILNLAINARDAMPDGGKLTIETCNTHLDDAYAARQRDVRPGQYVCICVTDTGTGMSAETIGRAFEPFFTTKPIGQGTGLGLSMIYGFARQSEGYAKIYSEMGRGTTLKLYLPRFRGEADAEDAPPAIAALAAAVGETVLVVEDEPVVRGLIVEVVTDLGYFALEAGDGPAGLALLQSKRRIDLLITDMGLPGLNGRQVADAGRALRPGLKVLFMTGYAENAALASGFLEPGMAMITKPFAMDALADRIRTVMEAS